jgi:4-amino-4-deoxy-L-arabinose transferase-like glycosyltransferase
MTKYKRFQWIRRIVVPALLLAAMLAVSWYAFSDAAESAERQQFDNMMRRIHQAVTACYAIEGRFPPNFAYLTEHYGIRVDETRFEVVYDIQYPNMRPAIEIRPITNVTEGDADDANR